MTTLTWTTPAGFLFTATELVSTTYSVTASGTTITYSLVAGNLPLGLSLSSTGTIYGIPSAVTAKTNSRFVVRAKTSGSAADRTFNIDVVGADAPIWNTAEGFLSVGIYGENYALNNQWVDFSLAASPVQAPTGTQLKYFIKDGGGKLPPGLTLTQSGKINGFVKDQLTFDSGISDEGGYDTESYDNYSYDHGSNFVSPDADATVTGLPKIYQFKVTATDDVASNTATFKIVVTSMDILKYNSTSMPATILINSSTNYIHPLQWINGTNLGVVRASNNEDINVKAYDATPLIGTVTYTLVTGTSILTNLPEGLYLDSTGGYIYGFLPYQPAYTKNYTLTINAVKTVSTSSVTATNTFTLAVKGEVESAIEWISTSSLGTIDTGVVSELAVRASHIKSGYNIKYQLTGGRLPDGLTLQTDGSISGQVEYNSTGTYTATIMASDVYELSSLEKSFNITVTERNSKKYTEIYVKPFLPKNKREIYREFISDTFTFDPALMYRYFDPNFGVQPNIKVVLEFGIEQINLGEYVVALRENFYRRRLYFGDLKTAIAKDSAGNVIYELIYLDAIDGMINNNGVGVSPVIYTNNNIYYPGSVNNMRRQLELLALNSTSYIGVDEYNLPKFMRTPQAGYYKPTNYVQVIPICYALPGQGSKIISRIKLTNFDFKQFDFEIDRIIVQTSKDSNTAKYLILERQAMGDLIEVDNYLFGPEGNVRIEDEDSNPLIRE